MKDLKEFEADFLGKKKKVFAFDKAEARKIAQQAFNASKGQKHLVHVFPARIDGKKVVIDQLSA